MIEPSPTAPEGNVRTLERYRPGDFPFDSAILCRNTAPLIGFAFDLLRRKVACHVAGRDIAAGLVGLVARVAGDDQFMSTTQLKGRLLDYRGKEVEKLIKKGKAEQAEAVEDKVAALIIFCEQCSDTVQLKRLIEGIFKDGPGITLSTVHRAKGLEWETVFILNFDLMPSPYATTAEEKEQEQNLIYVAITRAKLHLVYINSGNWNS